MQKTVCSTLSQQQQQQPQCQWYSWWSAFHAPRYTLLVFLLLNLQQLHSSGLPSDIIEASWRCHAITHPRSCTGGFVPWDGRVPWAIINWSDGIPTSLRTTTSVTYDVITFSSVRCASPICEPWAWACILALQGPFYWVETYHCNIMLPQYAWVSWVISLMCLLTFGMVAEIHPLPISRSPCSSPSSCSSYLPLRSSPLRPLVPHFLLFLFPFFFFFVFLLSFSSSSSPLLLLPLLLYPNQSHSVVSLPYHQSIHECATDSLQNLKPSSGKHHQYVADCLSFLHKICLPPGFKNLSLTR